MKAKYPAIVYHYSDASSIHFPNFMGCMSQTPDDETPTIETIIKLAQQVLKGFLHGEDIHNLPSPYSIKEACKYIDDQDSSEPYLAVSIIEVEVDFL